MNDNLRLFPFNRCFTSRNKDIPVYGIFPVVDGRQMLVTEPSLFSVGTVLIFHGIAVNTSSGGYCYNTSTCEWVHAD